MHTPLPLRRLLTRLPSSLQQAVGAPLAALALVGLGACATDQPSAVQAAANDRPAAVALRAMVPRTNAAAGLAQVRITLAYLRTGGATTPLGAPQLFSLGLETQRVPVSVDVASCVADPTRASASGGVAATDECLLQIELEFLLNSVRVDRQVLTNVSVRPGQTATVSEPVALALVSDVKIVVPTANQQPTGVRLERGQGVSLGVQIIDSDGKTVTGRKVRWSSSNASVATIDSNGVVSTIATGTTTITADVAGREATTSLLVLLPSRTIRVSAEGATGSGVVQSTPAGILCTVQAGVVSGSCSAVFPGEATVSLGATASSGSTFGAFVGDCFVTSAGACTVTEGATTRAVRATFAALRTLTVSTSGDGNGTVRATTAPIDCRGTAGASTGSCSAQVVDGASVALEATATAGSVFLGWSGDCSNAAGCSVLLTAPRTVTARFARLRSINVVGGAGAGGGTVSSSPAGILCTVAPGTTSGSCTTSVAPGTVVTFTANPNANSVFGGWSGACAGTGACVVTAAEAATIGANFLARRTVSVSGTGDGAGRVTSVTGAIACDLDAGTARGACSETLVEGTTAQLTAVPNAGHAFMGWTDACTGTAACAVLVNGNRTVAARFVRFKTVTVTARAGSGNGTVRSDPAGIACTIGGGVATGSCSAAFAPGTAVTLTSTAATNSSFAGWSGACQDRTPCAIVADNAVDVSAAFSSNRSLAVSIIGGGRVTSTPAGINCTTGATACSSTFAEGTVVDLRPVADPMFAFVGWSGDCAGGGACSVTMSGERAVTARFAPLRQITVTGSGSGGRGTVSSSPGGIVCTINGESTSGVCSAFFPVGMVVSFSASAGANSNSTFGGWSGRCTGTADCSFTVSDAASVTARFVGQKRVLNVSVTGEGSGTVTSSPGIIACRRENGGASGTCSEEVNEGTLVQLTATAAAGSSFAGWTGDCAGTGPCTVTMSSARSVSAMFVGPRLVTVVAGATGRGTVTSNPAGINCVMNGAGTSGTCSALLSGPVTLSASASNGSSFSGWGTPCSGTGECLVPATGSATVSASFTRPLFTLTVTVSGTLGSVSTSLGTCALQTPNTSTTCSYQVSEGETVALSASPGPQDAFGGWTGSCAGTGTCSILMGGNRSVSAQFVSGPTTINVSGSGSGVVLLGGLRCTISAGATSGTCNATVPRGQSITLGIDPTASFPFLGWSGACAGTALSCTLTPTGGTVSVSARFSSPGIRD